jgi:hypothetical protein
MALAWLLIGATAANAADMITGIGVSDARSMLETAGLSDISDRTGDPSYPSVGGISDDGFGVQITLHHCRDTDDLCGGVWFVAYIPSTSVANAQIIEGSLERSVVGMDVQVIPNVGSVPAAVEISTFILLEHGASEEIVPVTLGFLLSVVSETKGFMLSDDPAHADLWRRDDDN